MRLGEEKLTASIGPLSAETMVDRSVVSQMGGFPPTGVNAQLVWNVRNALDAEGFGAVKIIVSGGFDAARIHAFEEEGVPVGHRWVKLKATHILYMVFVVWVSMIGAQSAFSQVRILADHVGYESTAVKQAIVAGSAQDGPEKFELVDTDAAAGG